MDTADYQAEVLEAYITLSVLVPVMIAVLLVIALLILVYIISMNNRLKRFHLLVDRIFSEKLDRMDEEDEAYRKQRKLANTFRDDNLKDG